jgi:hypothetical protein
MTTSFLTFRKPIPPEPDQPPTPTPKTKWQKVRSLLVHPMLYLSILLHGGLLLIPATPEKKAEEKPEKKPDEISLTSLKPIAPTKLKPKAPVKVAVKPPIAPRIPVPANRVPPLALPKPAAPPPPKPAAAPAAAKPAAPAPEAQPTTQPSTLPTPPVEADYSAQFANALPGMTNSETASLGIPCALFAQPESFFTPASLQNCLTTGADPEWIASPSVAAFAWETRKKPDEVQTKLKAQFAGFSFTAIGQYGGGALFEVKQGATARYVNILSTKDGTGTLVIIWDGNPSAAQ